MIEKDDRHSACFMFDSKIQFLKKGTIFTSSYMRVINHRDRYDKRNRKITVIHGVQKCSALESIAKRVYNSGHLLGLPLFTIVTNMRHNMRCT